MKAKEYAEKYGALTKKDISASENKELVSAMFKELLGEMEDLVVKRHIKTGAAFDALKKEFDQKGNAISERLGGVLKRGWFLMLWKMAEDSKEDSKKAPEKAREKGESE